MTPEHRRLIERIRSSALVIRRAVEEAPRSRFGVAPRAGEWSALETLTHLRDVIVHVYGLRLRRLFYEDAPLFADFDEEAYRPASLARGESVEYLLDTIVGGTITNQFVPAVEKGCKELLEQGAVAGYRIQDVAVEVFFGKDHPVDSSEAAFKTAGRIAFRNAFKQAHPVLLEPIVNMEVTAPSKFTGAILGDLSLEQLSQCSLGSVSCGTDFLLAALSLSNVAVDQHETPIGNRIAAHQKGSSSHASQET